MPRATIFPDIVVVIVGQQRDRISTMESFPASTSYVIDLRYASLAAYLTHE